MCEDGSRCAFMLEVEINKIHSASAIRTVNFGKNSPLHTYTPS